MHILHLLLEALLVLLIIGSYLIGFLLPYIIRLLVKDLQNNDERVIATFLICFFAAMIIDYKSLDSGDIGSIALWFSGIYTESQAMFKLYLQPKWSSQTVGTSQPNTVPSQVAGD